MLSKSLASLTAVCFLTAAASGQAFNIDINVAPGMPPDNMNGGFPDIPGDWNAVPPGAVAQQLFGLTMVLDNSDITLSATAPGMNFGIPAAFMDLYEDYAFNQGPIETVTIDDLDVGDYTLVLYSWAPSASTFFEAVVGGVAVDSGIVNCPPTFPALGYVPGETLTTLSFSIVVPNDTLTINVWTEEFGVLNGIQLFETFGDAGCMQPVPNSQGGFPDIIGVGSNVTAQNSLSLRVGVLPGTLPPANPMNPGAIVCFASNVENASVPVTCPINPAVVTGVRCIGPGTLVRVLTGNPGAIGFTTTFGTYSLDVDLPFLASQGINTAPGSTIYFQMIYRDSPSAACASNLVRWTNSVGITLQ